LNLCRPLTVEDYGLQAAAETSPPKWHLAHTTWFFETFILKTYIKDYQCVDSHYEVLFNSYYNGIGAQHPRHQRGLLSRPSVQAIEDYRHIVDKHVENLLELEQHPHRKDIQTRVELGLHHEQQHQELLLTDLKYSWFQNPLHPVYCDKPLSAADSPPTTIGWEEYEGGLIDMGHSGDGFCFDNELPRHKAVLAPFALANHLISNKDYLEFILDGGYRDPQWWLADGWTEANRQQWQAPLYWLQQDAQWLEYTLHGLVPLDLQRPVVHVSAYEADAFARWRGARLATEYELESAANSLEPKDNNLSQFIEAGEFHPQAISKRSQLLGTAWQWTSSAYGPYPGFRAADGAIGEYNGKFMCNQLVLRGGSCFTPRDHLRPSYRNFFYPRDRWQVSTIRLARSL
jgi:ergothioneine biosynthesis protein EgtB